MNNAFKSLAAISALWLCTIGPAQAYIDPGTGSMLLQVLGAGIAAGIFYFRELRIKVMSLFSRRQAPAPEEGAEPPCDNPPR